MRNIKERERDRARDTERDRKSRGSDWKAKQQMYG